MEIDRHFIQENLSNGTICNPFVKTIDQVVDVLTKGIGSRLFHTALDKLGMREIYNLRESVESFVFLAQFFYYFFLMFRDLHVIFFSLFL